MKQSIIILLILNFLVIQISGEIFENTISSMNRSINLYFDQEYKFQPDANEITSITPVYEKRIFAIQFDEKKFCDDSYFKVTNEEVPGVSYIKNISNSDYYQMIASVFIESKNTLLTLDRYMNIHQFSIDLNATNKREYIQFIKQPDTITQQYDKAWLYYSNKSDMIVGFCKDFHFMIYLSDILKNQTNSNRINTTENKETYKDKIVNLIQLPDNNTRFLKVYSTSVFFAKIDFLSDNTAYLKEMTGQTTSEIRDASVSSLNIFCLKGDSKIEKYSYKISDLADNEIKLVTTYTMDQKLGDGQFIVKKIGSANTKVIDKLFFVGGYLTGIEYDPEDIYCVAEYFIDSKTLVFNRKYCSNEEIQSIQVFDRFAFIQRTSIHQFIHHSIPNELLDSSLTQNYLINQQLTSAVMHQSSKSNNSYYLISLQMINSYSISINFIKEEFPKLICLAGEDSYGEGTYNLKYKMKTSHCEGMGSLSAQSSCKLYQQINIELKEYDNNSKTGLIIGIIIGSIVIIIIVTILVYCFLHKRFEQKYEQLKEGYESEKYQQQQKNQYQSPQPVKQDDVQLQL